MTLNICYINIKFITMYTEKFINLIKEDNQDVLTRIYGKTDFWQRSLLNWQHIYDIIQGIDNSSAYCCLGIINELGFFKYISFKNPNITKYSLCGGKPLNATQIVERNIDIAIQYYEKAGDNNAVALRRLGSIYQCKRNYPKFLHYMIKSHEKKYYHATAGLVCIYAYGYGVEPDYKIAEKYHDLADLHPYLNVYNKEIDGFEEYGSHEIEQALFFAREHIRKNIKK